MYRERQSNKKRKKEMILAFIENIQVLSLEILPYATHSF